MDQLQGRVAVVTGAASGIGRGMARRAVKEGMRVVLADVEAEPLDDIASELAATGAEVLGAQTDVSKPDQVEALAVQAYDQFGAVHVLCNNAGVFQGGLAWQRTLADWEWVMGVNFWGVLHGIRSFVPRMLESGEEGHVVNTSSLAGLVTFGYSAPYVASKFAVLGMSECLAHDLAGVGAPIGVSVLTPGLVDTGIAYSTRNRPDEPPSEAQAPDAHFVEQALRDMTGNQGRPPDDVGDLVFDAIRANRFYINTTDAVPMLQQRFEAVLASDLPPSAAFGGYPQ